jgi:hypothetical protein
MHDDIPRPQVEQERQERDELLRADRRQDVCGTETGNPASAVVPGGDRLAQAGVPTVCGYPWASVALRRASATTAGVGSTGDPIDRSTMPPGCSAAWRA